jgi:hypothetical protein
MGLVGYVAGVLVCAMLALLVSKQNAEQSKKVVRRVEIIRNLLERFDSILSGQTKF